MSQQIPKLLFVGAGNIAQSIIRGIIKARPSAADQILATAPSIKNLTIIDETLGCHTALLKKPFDFIEEFKPDFVFLCVKPQVLLSSAEKSQGDNLADLLRSKSIKSSTILTLLAGIKTELFTAAFDMDENRVVRVMLNTAAEIGATNVLYYIRRSSSDLIPETRLSGMKKLFELLGQAICIEDEKLMDVGTGVCGSGIAFFYEMIQTISDIGVKNGLSRSDSTLIAAQLSKSAGEMLLSKQKHPYQLRDEVTSPAGTTIYGLSSWHEHSTSQKIAQAFQSSIDRAKSLSLASEANYKSFLNDDE